MTTKPIIASETDAISYREELLAANAERIFSAYEAAERRDMGMRFPVVLVTDDRYHCGLFDLLVVHLGLRPGTTVQVVAVADIQMELDGSVDAEVDAALNMVGPGVRLVMCVAAEGVSTAFLQRDPNTGKLGFRPANSNAPPPRFTVN